MTDRHDTPPGPVERALRAMIRDYERQVEDGIRQEGNPASWPRWGWGNLSTSDGVGSDR